MDWFINNWDHILQAITLIVMLTPTKEDNGMLDRGKNLLLLVPEILKAFKSFKK